MTGLVNGYFIVWDDGGIPGLVRGNVLKVTDTTYLLPNSSTSDYPYYKAVTLGIDFFQEYVPALTVLQDRLGDALRGHIEATENIKRHIAINKELLEELHAQGR